MHFFICELYYFYVLYCPIIKVVVVFIVVVYCVVVIVLCEREGYSVFITYNDFISMIHNIHDIHVLLIIYIWDLKTKKLNVCETNTHIIYHFLPAFRKVVKKSWLIFCDEPRIMLKPDYDVWLYKYLPYGSMSL